MGPNPVADVLLRRGDQDTDRYRGRQYEGIGRRPSLSQGERTEKEPTLWTP